MQPVIDPLAQGRLQAILAAAPYLPSLPCFTRGVVLTPEKLSPCDDKRTDFVWHQRKFPVQYRRSTGRYGDLQGQATIVLVTFHGHAPVHTLIPYIFFSFLRLLWQRRRHFIFCQDSMPFLVGCGISCGMSRPMSGRTALSRPPPGRLNSGVLCDVSRCHMSCWVDDESTSWSVSIYSG